MDFDPVILPHFQICKRMVDIGPEVHFQEEPIEAIISCLSGGCANGRKIGQNVTANPSYLSGIRIDHGASYFGTVLCLCKYRTFLKTRDIQARPLARN